MQNISFSKCSILSTTKLKLRATKLGRMECYERRMEYEVKLKSITAETHDLTWKTPPMRREKTTGTSQQQSHYLKSLGYSLWRLTRESSLQETLATAQPSASTGLRFAPSEARPISCSEFGTTPTWSSLVSMGMTAHIRIFMLFLT
jgi:hypothetical protein